MFPTIRIFAETLIDMMKYPIGIQSFAEIINDGYVYVDKTALIYQLVTTGKIYFLSRPRRFGKSLLVDTLACYFEGKKELFAGLAIDKQEKEWKKYPVFRVDFNGGNYEIGDSLEKRIEGYLSRWEQTYGKNPIYTTTGERFMEVLRRAHEQTGERCVVLIDEYDKPILDVLDTGAKTPDEAGELQLVEDKHRNTLKGFYSTFKAADNDLKFVLLTGVTKFSQVSVFSGFNQPNDISMDGRYDALCGITQEELHTVFAEPIEQLAVKYKCTVEEMKQKLRLRYDGYHFTEEMTDIYNPFSILNAMSKQRMDDYWFSTGTPTYLIRLMNHNRTQMDDLTGRYYDRSMFVDYKADVEKPLPMIYQSGYLTIKDFNLDSESYLLDIPNNEVRKGFLSMIAANYLNPQSSDPISWIGQAFVMLNKGMTGEFRDSFTAFLASIPYDAHEGIGKTYIDDEAKSAKAKALTEKHFQYTFYLILRLLGVYCLYVEHHTAQGRVDCLLEMKNYVYIFEFKLDGTADEALRQIEDKGYARPYADDPRKIVKIGVSFSSKTCNIEEWKEA